MVEDRITALEARASTLEARVQELEGPPPPTPPTREETAARYGLVAYPEEPRVSPPPPKSSPPPRSPARPAAAERPARPDVSPPREERPARDLEDLLGGQVLAWVGGIAVLAGLAFLLTIAISRGWIGEGARTALAGALSLGLLAIGIRLRAGRTEAALAATAVGIAGCFGTLQVAGAVYGLVPLVVAELGALATGALAVTLGIRWGAQVLGWLGLIGALLAPPALGALDHGGIVFVALAFAAAIAVIVWQGWTYQAWAAYAIATLDWLAWAEQPQSRVAGTAALFVFGGLTAALAFGFELRGRRLNPTAAALVGLNALILVGVAVMQEQLRATLAVLAIAHLAVLWMPRISRDLRLVAVAIGVVLADIAAPLFLDGLPLVIFWAAPALVFAALVGARRRPQWVDNLVGSTEDRELRPVALFGRAEPVDWVFAATGMVAQLVLAIAHVISFDAPWTMLSAQADAHALIADAIVGLTVWGAARLSRSGWLDGVALTTLVYMTGQALDSLSLTLALALEAIALTRFTRIGAMVFAGLATTHALVVLAPPLALVVGLDDPLEAAAGMLAATAAIWFSTRHKGLTALALLYLASVEAVTVGPDHTGQTLLSVLWAVAGVGTLVYGLIRDERETRLAALGLIGVTATKVFLYDLASLDSLYRVGSFIGFGLLLLAGAFAYQRVRPRLPLEA